LQRLGYVLHLRGSAHVCAQGQLDVLRRLVTPDNVNQKNARELTPLHLASKENHVPCVEFLLLAGAGLLLFHYVPFLVC
jgi:hypothetical protein